MVLHHVAQRAGMIVVSAPSLYADAFGNRDLHMIDMARIPQRLEQRIGEAQDHQVLHGLLTEIVVDSIEMVLIKGVRQLCVEGAVTGKVIAERLLDNQSRGGRQNTARLDALADRPEE